MESWRGGDHLVCGRVGGRTPSGLRACPRRQAVDTPSSAATKLCVSWLKQANSSSVRMPLGPNIGIAESQNRTVAPAPKTSGGNKPAIFNLWSTGWAGTAIGLRTAALSLVAPTVERPCEKGEAGCKHSGKTCATALGCY